MKLHRKFVCMITWRTKTSQTSDPEHQATDYPSGRRAWSRSKMQVILCFIWSWCRLPYTCSFCEKTSSLHYIKEKLFQKVKHLILGGLRAQRLHYRIHVHRLLSQTLNRTLSDLPFNCCLHVWDSTFLLA